VKPKEGNAADLLHRIRASVRELRKESSRSECADQHVAERLSDLLRHALSINSPSEIVVILACGAELRIFPQEDVLERCTETVQASGHAWLCGVVWRGVGS